ncbi:IS3 family transposase [Acetohalobium arabaticum]|nr:IS3 family transposase [Acetohalobium arabaticum]
MGEKRKSYTEEFKKDAVELSNRSDKTVKDVSENLDIPYGTLVRWRREYKDKGDLAFPGHGKQKLTSEQKEIQRLKKELKDAKTERDILKKAGKHLLERTEVIYGFIRDHSDQFTVVKMCQVLEVSRSGYYKWLNRKPSQREKINKKLKLKIAEIYWQHNGTYGSPRIHRVLRKEGYTVNIKRVARLMRIMGLKAIQKRKFKRTTNSNHDLPLKENLLKRDFDIDKPDKVWVSDITYISTKKGWLYLAVVIDLYSRKVVGYSMSKRINTDLIMSATKMAISRRNPEAGLIFHSDRGSQYASHKLQNLFKQHSIRSSMSRKGDCWDNAVAESFFGSLKTELVYHKKYLTRNQARLDIFEYIAGYYNKVRLHSYLNYMSPKNYEKERKMA